MARARVQLPAGSKNILFLLTIDGRTRFNKNRL